MYLQRNSLDYKMKIRKCISYSESEQVKRKNSIITKQAIQRKISCLFTNQGTSAIKLLQQKFKFLDKQKSYVLSQHIFRMGLHDGQILLSQQQIAFLIGQYSKISGINYVRFLRDLGQNNGNKQNRNQKYSQQALSEYHKTAQDQNIQGLQFYQTRNKRSIHNKLVYEQIKRSLSLNFRQKRPFSSLLANQFDRIKHKKSFKKQNNSLLKKKVLPHGMKFWQKMDVKIKQRNPRHVNRLQSVGFGGDKNIFVNQNDLKNGYRVNSNQQKCDKDSIKKIRSIGTAKTASTNHTNVRKVFYRQLNAVSKSKNTALTPFTYLYEF